MREERREEASKRGKEGSEGGRKGEWVKGEREGGARGERKEQAGERERGVGA